MSTSEGPLSEPKARTRNHDLLVASRKKECNPYTIPKFLPLFPANPSKLLPSGCHDNTVRSGRVCLPWQAQSANLRNLESPTRFPSDPVMIRVPFFLMFGFNTDTPK